MVKKCRPPYRTPKSQEVLRQKAFETTFSGVCGDAQSGALSAKPRVVRGFGQLGIALSEFKVEEGVVHIMPANPHECYLPPIIYKNMPLNMPPKSKD